MLKEEELSPGRLAEAVDRAARLDLSKCRPIKMDGAAETARFIARRFWGRGIRLGRIYTGEIYIGKGRAGKMTDWIETLYRELDEWNYDGVAATFWWRDDDAQSPSAELDGLIGLAQKYDVPLALAVIPRGMECALASRVKPLAKVAVLAARFFPRKLRPAR